MKRYSKAENALVNRLHSNVGKAIHKYNLINSGDRILIGVSGGKDSLGLLKILGERRRYSKINFDIIAVHINVLELEYEADREYLNNICDNLNIEIIYRDINVDFEAESNKPACFRCSWHRRVALFDLAKELNCNKLALGHHMDDALETLVMNMMYQATMSSLPAKLAMFNGDLDIIRPLILLTDNEMKEYCRINNFKLENKNCKYEDLTKRKATSKIIDNMTGGNKQLKVNMFRSMSKVQDEYLP
ncbi:MAG: tRNA 2-thiocytidine(32) synthetase TtcA [Bacteroidales bacterium]|jgi:tRNA(Ile)-lysidine synthetase-like protein|nr:tRNA 2-thiocytidine(32) synthetase TtcA [Bacteroidales bacterium]